MSPTIFHRRRIAENVDVIAAGAGVLLATTVIPLRSLSTNPFILGMPLAIGVASFLYLVSVRDGTNQRIWPLPGWAARLLPSICILGMAGLVIVAAISDARTLWFYNLAIGIAIFLCYQIVFARHRDLSLPIILGQIVVFAFILRLTALTTTPGYVGIDIWTHVPNWTAGILETNSLEPLDGRKYYAAPWFHLLVATTALFTGVSLETALTLSVGLVMPGLVLLVYATARIIIAARWAAFAAMIFAIIGYTIEWSIHLIPTSLGLVFFTGVFYLLCRLLYYRFDVGEFLLLILLNMAVVLTHQVATFITLVLLVASVLTLLLLPSGLFADVGGSHTLRGTKRESTNLTGLTLFDIGFVTFMWSFTPYYGRSFLETTFIFFRDTLTESEGFGDLAGETGPDEAVGSDPGELAQFVSLIDASTFILLFFLTIIGVLAILHRERRSYPTSMMGAAIFLMSIFVFAFPMFGVRSFIPTRWYAFMAIPMIVLGAIGASHLIRNIRPSVAVTILVCLILIFPAATLVSSNATIDNPRFESEQTRYSYSPAELAAVETVDGIFHSDDVAEANWIQTDHPYQTVFDRTETHNASLIEYTEDGMDDANRVVYREYLESGAAFVRGDSERSYAISLSEEMICGAERSVIYDNGEVTICVA